jgi:arsenate reductase (thioredoxin)
MPNSVPPYKVIFLCTGNSARSIFGEYLLRRAGGNRFQVFSAGSFPTGKVNPFAIQVLKDVYFIDASEARSKSWEQFKDVTFDFVFTVCDAARESCPYWPGQPIIAHWSLPDPALAEGTDQEKLKKFKQVAQILVHRIGLFCVLPLEKLDRLRLVNLVQNIDSVKPEVQRFRNVS